MRNDENEGQPQGPQGPEVIIPKLQLLQNGVVIFMGDVLLNI